MAIETRSLAFNRSTTEGEIDSQTLELPTDRTHIGATILYSGPILFVRGEWDTTEAVDISFVRHENLPTAATVVGCVSDDGGNGFVGVIVES
jgi:hypothetical protein